MTLGIHLGRFNGAIYVSGWFLDMMMINMYTFADVYSWFMLGIVWNLCLLKAILEHSERKRFWWMR